MKKLLMIVPLLLLLSAPVVYAQRWHHQPPPPSPAPAPAPAPVPLGSQNLCMNYGHQATSYNMTQVSQDLSILSQAKINCLRLSYMGWNNLQSEALALYAKSKGFRVILGGDWGTLTPSQLSSYQSQVLTEAQWAQTNHIDQLSLGNEQEYRLSGLTKDQWVSFLQSLASQVKQVYSGQVSYETSGDFASYWATKSLGSIDLLGLNVYCGYDCNANDVNINIQAHGINHVYISETNADMSTGNYNNDSTHASEVSGDTVKLLNLGVPLYFFTFSTCNNADGVPSYWGLFQCNNLAQPLTAALLGI
ncbi:MAG: hypothetical protein KGL39_27040 [Patescibacteria group bacterium]|nr:hypothetical protein [Patescibacteria group bacterium]